MKRESKKKKKKSNNGDLKPGDLVCRSKENYLLAVPLYLWDETNKRIFSLATKTYLVNNNGKDVAMFIKWRYPKRRRGRGDYELSTDLLKDMDAVVLFNNGLYIIDSHHIEKLYYEDEGDDDV